MAKKDQKNKRLQEITLWFGYGIFVLLVLSVTISTIIPFGGMLFQTHVLLFNVVISLIALVGGALFPALLSYILGDRLTPGKNPLTHHYNGILFGFLAYWLMLISGYFGIYINDFLDKGDYATRLLLVNAWPIVVTIIVTTLIGVGFARKKNVTDVSKYGPYQLVLLISAGLIGVVLPIFNQFSSLEFIWQPFISLAAFVAVVGISYAILRKTKVSRLQKLTNALLGVTVGSATLFVVTQLMPFDAFLYSPINFILFGVSLVIGIGAGFGYLIALRRYQ